jgi:hypothetical protein
VGHAQRERSERYAHARRCRPRAQALLSVLRRVSDGSESGIAPTTISGMRSALVDTIKSKITDSSWAIPRSSAERFPNYPLTRTPGDK